MSGLQFLFKYLGRMLWNAISRTTGNVLLIPFVCGYMYRKEAFMYINDLLEDWQLIRRTSTYV